MSQSVSIPNISVTQPGMQMQSFGPSTTIDVHENASDTQTLLSSTSDSSRSSSSFQPQPQQQAPQSSPGHPTACFFNVFFKALALVIYLFCGWVYDGFILVFIICVLLLAFDFWTVKNVTGRLLVGLRWWNEVKEDGTNVWIFESKADNRQVNSKDSFLFWITLYLQPLVWILLGIGAFLGAKFTWLLVVAVAVVLGGANVIGYWKCQKDAKKKVQSLATNFILQQL